MDILEDKKTRLGLIVLLAILTAVGSPIGLVGLVAIGIWYIWKGKRM